MRSHDPVPAEPLMRLSQMPEYAVDRHHPDPRGWSVVNGRGQKVGEVKDLVVDTRRMAARYLDIELDRKRFHLHGDDPHVLVPIERAHRDGKHLVVQELTETWVSDVCAKRSRHAYEFWDSWWHRGEPRADDVSRVAPPVHADELDRVIHDMRPGETVRIPVVNEEIVVQRRAASDEAPREHVVINRADDEPPLRR